ncbi:MAG: hypothetical protein ACO1N5_03985, partial [Noviherbaspirillum sp.]
MPIIHPHTGLSEDLPDPEDGKSPAVEGGEQEARPDFREPPEQYTRTSVRKPASRNKFPAPS